MSKRVFLHIGGEKTGTTTLQRFLSMNAPRLKRAGFYYPCEPSNVCFAGIAHFPIAACLIDGRVEFIDERSRAMLPFVLENLTERISSTAHDVILSCEHFSSRVCRDRQLLKLRDALPADDVKIVFYIREPSDLALAAWSTAVRCGARNAFNPDLVTPENRYYNHLETLNLWSSVFGEPNMIVREFKRSRLVGGDIRSDFCALLGIQPDEFAFEEDENRSFDLQRLEVLRHINCALPDFQESDCEWRRAQEIRDLISAYIPDGGLLKALMSREAENHIKSRFRAINQEISERYFAGRLSANWFPSISGSELRDQHPFSGDLALVLRETIIRMAETNIDARAKDRKAKRTLEKAGQKILQLFSKSSASQ